MTPEQIEATKARIDQMTQQQMDMQITKLEVENVKRLKAVLIKPNGHVIVGGENESGKSAVLDSIKYALGGAKHIPGRPLRVGEKHGHSTLEIELDGGERLTVTRNFTEKSSTIKVTDANGRTFASPQALLDSLFGSLTFDPSALLRMKPADQAEALRLAAGIDLTQVDAEIADAFERRTECNRDVKLLAAQVEVGKMDDPDVPQALVDIEALASQREQFRLEIEHRMDESRLLDFARTKELQAQQSVVEAADIEKAAQEELRLAKVLSDEAALHAKAHRGQGDIADDMTAVEAKIEALTARRRELMTEQVDARDEQQVLESAEYEKQLKTRTVVVAQAGLSNAEKRRDEVEITTFKAGEAVDSCRDEVLIEADLDAINVEIQSATVANAAYEAAASHRKLANDLGQAKAEAFIADKAVTAAREAKAELLQSLNVPVPGLTISDEGVMLNGLPFEQASQAEQLRVSAAVGMAANPKLRVMMMRDGSVLNEKSLALLCEMGTAGGYQFWIERVGEDKHSTVIIEDGSVRANKEPEHTLETT